MHTSIAKGNFVSVDTNPEYGVGRVLAVGAFATRVLFPVGGLRLFRLEDHDRLRTTASPSAADIAVLDKKEADLARGIIDRPVLRAEVPAPKKSAARKKTVSARA